MSVDQRPQQARPHSKGGFSFKSEKSHNSNSNISHKRKESLKETHDEKSKIHLSDKTKADPNAALNEEQPMAAALGASTMGSLSAQRWFDANGAPITEPDRSNPTRSRWERPLDTIRSFEASIDNEFKSRRSSMVRAESSPDVTNGYGTGSRRNSYYGYGGNNREYDSQAPARYSQVGGYYGNRMAARDRARESYAGGEQPYMGGPPRNRYNPRLQSDPALNRPDYNNGVYPGHGYQRSRDTINTGSNGSTPSSENSSFERGQAPPVRQPDLGEQYGFSGFGNAPVLDQYNQNQGAGYPAGNGASYPNGYGQNGGYTENSIPVPTPPTKAQTRTPIRLGGGDSTPLSQSSGNVPSNRPTLKANNSEKRKSWFKRRFSKD